MLKYKNQLSYWIINYLNIIIIWRWVVLVHRLNRNENPKEEDHVLTVYNIESNHKERKRSRSNDSKRYEKDT